MALTHVCMWKDKSWKRISAYEAAKLFPYGASAYSGLFMCELCGQYVSLVNGSIQNSHLRHSASEENKDCDDRSESYSYSNFFQAENHNLPIKLKINSSKTFSLSIGFISLPDRIMRDKGNYKIYISGEENYTYSFDRLNKGTVTYLDIGNKPADKYRISISPSLDGIRSFWPSDIKGIDRRGTLFDKETGKRIPYDADVQVGHEYYLLTGITRLGYHRTISKREVCIQTVGWQNWRIYEISALEFSKEAASFFLDYHCRLTDEPITMYPIWPIHIESPYIIYHKSKQINIYFKGNAETKLAPVGSIVKYPYNNPKLLSISSIDRQQLLSAGRTEVLKYMYFWEAELNKKGYLPKVVVCDINGDEINSGKHDVLPNKNTICIIPETDGFFNVILKGIVIEKYNIIANQRFEYDNVKYEYSIDIFQGLDCIWSASFERVNRVDQNDEDELLSIVKNLKGKRIKIDHSIGAILKYFDSNSPIKQWLYKQIKNGYISADAKKHIRKYVEQIR